MSSQILTVTGLAAAGQVISAILAFALVATMEVGELGRWGLATSVTQYLDLAAIGSIQWLTIEGLRATSTADLRQHEGEALAIVLKASPLPVAVLACVGWASGLSRYGALAFGIASGAMVVNGWQIARLRVRGRLAFSNAIYFLDRLTMLVALLVVGLVLRRPVTVNLLATFWLVGQILILIVAIRAMPWVAPRMSAKLLSRRSYLWMALSGSGTSGISSLARIPLAAFGPAAVGNFVAATYLALPILALAGAIDQVAFVQSNARWGGAAKGVWRRAIVVTAVGSSLCAVLLYLFGPTVLVQVRPEYSRISTIAGPVLAWGIAVAIGGLAVKALFAQDQMRTAALFATAVAVTGALSTWAAVTFGLSFEATVRAYALGCVASTAALVFKSGICSALTLIYGSVLMMLTGGLVIGLSLFG